MSKLQKEIKYFDAKGEILLEPKEVIKMTPELETKLEQAIGLVQECGYIVDMPNGVNSKSKIDYTVSNRIYAKLLIILLQLVVSGLVLFQGYYSFLYWILGFVLLLVISIYLDISKAS